MVPCMNGTVVAGSGVFGLAFLTSASIFLNILSCILAEVWWPLFILGFHTLALSSALFFKGTVNFFSTDRAAPVMGPPSIMEQWGNYLTAFFIWSSFGLGELCHFLSTGSIHRAMV